MVICCHVEALQHYSGHTHYIRKGICSKPVLLFNSGVDLVYTNISSICTATAEQNICYNYTDISCTGLHTSWHTQNYQRYTLKHVILSQQKCTVWSLLYEWQYHQQGNTTKPKQTRLHFVLYQIQLIINISNFLLLHYFNHIVTWN